MSGHERRAKLTESNELLCGQLASVNEMVFFVL
jgi:hypothetical protein